MKDWEKRLYQLTRQRDWLIAACLLTVGVFLAAGWSLQYVLPRSGGADHYHRGLVKRGLPAFADYLISVADAQENEQPVREFNQLVATANLSEEQSKLLAEFYLSLVQRKPTSELVVQARQSVNFANYLLARAIWRESKPTEAFEYARREQEINPTKETRLLAVDLALQLRAYDWLRESAHNPGFWNELPIYKAVLVARALGDWGTVLRLSLVINFIDVRIDELMLVLTASGVWLIIFFQSAGAGLRERSRLLLILGGFLLGLISVVPVDLKNLAIGDLMNIARQDGSGYVYAAYVLYVALPEEISKLALFALLLPWIARRNSESEAFLTAAAVGLGFATTEVLGYLHSEGLLTVVGRFFSSVVLHFTLTALAGLPLARAFVNPRRYLNEFLAAFAMVTLLHGVYDGAIELGEVSRTYLPMLIRLYLIWRFFGVLNQIREPRHDTISLTATFLLGNCFIAGVLLLEASLSVGTWTALRAVSYEFAAQVFVLFIIVRRLGQT